MRFKTLAKAIAELREAFAGLAQGKVATLNIARADLRWRAAYYVAGYCDYLCRAVAARCFRYGKVGYAVRFRDGAVCGPVAERVADGALVRPVAVR
jgi:hypothetical protein